MANIKGLKFTEKVIYEIAVMGGPGSGHHGHGGRPGSVGGSAPGGGIVRVSLSELDSTGGEGLALWKGRNAEIMRGGDKELATLVTKLTQGNPTAVVVSKAWEPDLNLLASSRSHLFSQEEIIFKKGQPNQCHHNVTYYYNQGEIDSIVTGYGLGENGIWLQHSWGLKNGKVVETTVGRIRYFGVELTPEEAIAFGKANP